MEALGIVLDDLGMSQLSTELAYSIYDGVEKVPMDLCAFFVNPEAPFITLKLPLLNSIAITKFHGSLITTSLANLHFSAKNTYKNNPIYHYAYNLEWVCPNLHHESFKQTTEELFKHPRVKIIARCEDHARKIEGDFGIKPIFICNTCDINKLIEGINNANTTK